MSVLTVFALLKKRITWKEILFFVFTLFTIVLATKPYWDAESIIKGHEELSYVSRAELYADHFRQGDIFPIWSSGDAYTFGSPLPLFYQKTYYYVSGVAALFFEPKIATVLSVGLFFVLGVYGMRYAVRQLRLGWTYEFLIPFLFTLSFYIATAWLVRSAMAEFSAIMCIPWLIGLCIRLLRKGEWSWGIPMVLLVTFFSHNAFAIFSIFLLLIALGVALLRYKQKARSILMRACISAGLFFVCIIPHSILQLVMLQDYNPANVLTPPFVVYEHFIIWEYILGLDKYMSLSSLVVTTQFGHGLVLFFPVILVWLVTILWRKKQKRSLRGAGLGVPETVFFMITLTFYVYLLFQSSEWLYRVLPFLEFIQFPWRLHGITTPLALLAIALWVARGIPLRAVRALFLGVWLVVTLWYSPLMSAHDAPAQFSQEEIEQALGVVAEGGWGTSLTVVYEYFPVIYNAEEGKSHNTSGFWFRDRFAEGHSDSYQYESCSVEQFSRNRTEPLSSVVVIYCDTDTAVPLPFNYSPFHELNRLTAVGSPYEDAQLIKQFRDLEDPRMYINVSSGEYWIVRIDHPTMPRAYRSLWKHFWARII